MAKKKTETPVTDETTTTATEEPTSQTAEEYYVDDAPAPPAAEPTSEPTGDVLPPREQWLADYDSGVAAVRAKGEHVSPQLILDLVGRAATLLRE